MYLLYRAAFTLYDFRGDNPRKRKDELLCTLNREYAAGDIVQIQFFRRDLIPFLNRWPILQTIDLCTSNKIPFPRSTGKYSSRERFRGISAVRAMLFSYHRDAGFIAARHSPGLRLGTR